MWAYVGRCSRQLPIPRRTVSLRVMEILLARQTLSYNPTTSLLEGLKKTWGWYVEHQDAYFNKMHYFRE
jgi:nucleoside-diphosphate-sugar epimerase